jgi:hypothetical protein
LILEDLVPILKNIFIPGSEYGNSSIPPSFKSGDPIISEAKSEPLSSPQASLGNGNAKNAPTMLV